MRTVAKLACTAGLMLILAACGGSQQSSSTGATTDLACSGAGCERNNLPAAPLACGGVASTKCPQGYRCVDDTGDSCTPANGAADCSGICVLGGELASCGGL